MRERRQATRVPDLRSLRVSVLSCPETPALETRTFHCLTHDISYTGVSFSAHTRLPDGTMVRIEDDQLLAAWGATSLVGQVCWGKEVEADLVSTYAFGCHLMAGHTDVEQGWHKAAA